MVKCQPCDASGKRMSLYCVLISGAICGCIPSETNCGKVTIIPESDGVHTQLSLYTESIPLDSEEVSSPIPVLVEEGAESVKFLLSWRNSASILDFRLACPDGSSFPSDTAVKGETEQVLQVQDPSAGTWTMTVFGKTVGQSPEHFTVSVYLTNSRIHLSAGLANQSVDWPTPFLVSANPTVGLPVVGCHASALVVRPDGTSDTILLMDDGSGVDAAEADGLYQAEYKDFSAGNGTYTFAIAVSCKEDTASLLNEGPPGIGAFPVTADLQSFNRMARVVGTVSGAPTVAKRP